MCIRDSDNRADGRYEFHAWMEDIAQLQRMEKRGGISIRMPQNLRLFLLLLSKRLYLLNAGKIVLQLCVEFGKRALGHAEIRAYFMYEQPAPEQYKGDWDTGCLLYTSRGALGTARL